MTLVKSRATAHSAPPGERLYAIGDIHGRLDLFKALLERIEADNAQRETANARIILLGDLIDRGPDSAAVVDHALRWDRSFATMDSLMGNHEASLLAVLKGETRWMESWLDYGGRETLISYGMPDDLVAEGPITDIVRALPSWIPEDHKSWLKDRPLSLRHGDYVFAHAGILPGRALDEQEAKHLLWIRSDFLDDETDHGAMIVHGHTISDEPEERHNRIGIDTGAYSSNRLTALALEENRRWFLQT